MKAQYTPGPWVVTGQETSRYTSTIRHIDETLGQRKELWIADCTKHDAKLISAAPELLHVANNVYFLLSNIDWNGRNTEQGQKILSDLRDTIAKATGQ